MNFAENYFQKYSYLSPQIKEPPSGLLRFSVIIPAYLEDNIFESLEALKNTAKPEGDIEIIVVVNFSEDDSPANKNRNICNHELLNDWCIKNNNNTLKFYSILADNLPKRHAGVGLARKIGMDEAVARFGLINYPKGIILSLDADAKVEMNYFTSLEKKILDTKNFGTFIYQFVHDIEGDEFDQDIYDAAAEYELHMRYYMHILHYSGFPYSNYTIGSCFGVNAEVYAGAGGMNRRQAGEDFYFLSKVFPNTVLVEITDSCIFLSSRPSTRVPFGTGQVVSRLSKQMDTGYCTYAPEAFYDLKCLFSSLNQLYDLEIDSLTDVFETLPQPMKDYLRDQEFFGKLKEIKANTSSLNSFTKRFYSWFDGFKVVKFLNFAHQVYYQRMPVCEAVNEFLGRIGYQFNNAGVRNLLDLFRKLDKEGKRLNRQL